MNVQELIDKLIKIPNKNLEVKIESCSCEGTIYHIYKVIDEDNHSMILLSSNPNKFELI